ncbi:hypothetical protein B6N60_02710 [Richelia sinica FACHB-800]|uniref:Uncharacterized protein n=1 Tax=Richelia sinica FACHB-800 TaxID=1357546 RepID=A0A975T9N6_9NOST|nr:hypothetical protein B6N60_02710 [Richelia sinica FACHB-800]
MSNLPFNLKAIAKKSIDSSFNLQRITIRKIYGHELDIRD